MTSCFVQWGRPGQAIRIDEAPFFFSPPMAELLILWNSWSSEAAPDGRMRMKPRPNETESFVLET